MINKSSFCQIKIKKHILLIFIALHQDCLCILLNFNILYNIFELNHLQIENYLAPVFGLCKIYDHFGLKQVNPICVIDLIEWPLVPRIQLLRCSPCPWPL